MVNYIKYGTIAIAVACVYMAGYYKASVEGDLAIESIKLEHAKAIIETQENEKARYEKTIKGLVAALDELRVKHDDRLHELEDFRQRTTDLDTCHRQRGDLARVAVGLEGVAERAIVLIEGGQK